MKLITSVKTLIKNTAVTMLLTIALLSNATAQSVDDIRWKSEEQVRNILGEPLTSTPPVGTHATYTLWKYETFIVAFANSRAFHLFDKNSLQRVKLDENRSGSDAP